MTLDSQSRRYPGRTLNSLLMVTWDRGSGGEMPCSKSFREKRADTGLNHGSSDLCLGLLWTHLGPCFLEAYDLIGNKTDIQQNHHWRFCVGVVQRVRTLRVRGGPGGLQDGKGTLPGDGVAWKMGFSREQGGQWQERGPGMKSRVARRIDELRHSLLNQSPGEGSCSLLPHRLPL